MPTGTSAMSPALGQIISRGRDEHRDLDCFINDPTFDEMLDNSVHACLGFSTFDAPWFRSASVDSATFTPHGTTALVCFRTHNFTLANVL